MTLHPRMHMLTVAAVCLTVASASAQTRPTTRDWRHGTMLSVSAGAGFDGTHTGAAAGMGLGWEVLPWFAVEGSGSWLDRGHASAFAAAMKGQFGLLKGRRPIVPFLEGGVGLYRLSFTGDEPAVPEFYRRRMVARLGAAGHSTTFTDPTLVAGGGVALFLNRHVSLRPAIETAFVMRDSRTHPVTTAAVRLTYHFEDHPITPSR